MGELASVGQFGLCLIYIAFSFVVCDSGARLALGAESDAAATLQRLRLYNRDSAALFFAVVAAVGAASFAAALSLLAARVCAVRPLTRPICVVVGALTVVATLPMCIGAGAMSMMAMRQANMPISNIGGEPLDAIARQTAQWRGANDLASQSTPLESSQGDADRAQRALRCCGLDNYTEWLFGGRASNDSAATAVCADCAVPLSCCRPAKNQTGCNARDEGGSPQYPDRLFHVGCRRRAAAALGRISWWLFGLLVVQLIAGLLIAISWFDD